MGLSQHKAMIKVVNTYRAIGIEDHQNRKVHGTMVCEDEGQGRLKSLLHTDQPNHESGPLACDHEAVSEQMG